jgi:hypothetical protein
MFLPPNPENATAAATWGLVMLRQARFRMKVSLAMTAGSAESLTARFT